MRCSSHEGIGIAIGLAVIWVLLWGSASLANVVGGLRHRHRAGADRARVAASPAAGNRGPPVAILRFVGHLLAHDREVERRAHAGGLVPSSSIRTGVVGVPLPGCSDELLTLISNLLALAPGTMPLELTQDPIVLYVHVLHVGDVEQVRRDILHLTDLTVRAFGSPDAVAAQDELPRRRRRGGRHVIAASYVMLGVATALFAFRLLRGPSLADRVIGIDGMIVTGMSLIIVQAMDTGRGAFLPAAVVLALVSFISTSVIARYIEGRGE